MGHLRALLSRVLLVILTAQMAAAAPRPAPREDRPVVASSHKALARQIEKVLADADVARGFWGVHVVSLDSGRTLFSFNGEKLFTPASNTKLFTTAAALAMIGPDHRFRTSVETPGMLDRHGRLTGDLMLVGRGDPNLSGRTLPYRLKTERTEPPIRVLESLADQLVAKGLKYVDGDIIGDDSYFAFERYGEGWALDDMMWESGAPVSALSINDNVIFVNILPADHPGDKAFVSINPFPDYYRLDNRIITTPSGTGPRRVYINRDPGSNVLTLWGNMPLDDAGASQALAIEDPADFAAQLFRRLLERRGVAVYGRSRTRHTELANLTTFSVTTMASAGGGDINTPAPHVVRPLVLASYESQPLREDLRVINKVSQNLHAELLLRLLGREKGTTGTTEGGLEVLRGFLAQAGVHPDEYVFFDGSGMSRQNLATPTAIVKLLQYATTQPWGKFFEDTLPVAGRDGTLGERFRASRAGGRVMAKSGLLGHVNALSGYATTIKGERVVFSVITNNHNMSSRRGMETIDRIVEAIVNDKK
jgi:D-alanyl-D-alanine carboxypeptidase/D-alanyl-D-alanine-endopeptidase (penicillin-binding protein 4)